MNPRRPLHCWPRALAALGLCLLSLTSAADDASDRADQIKAAYLFNFIKFVEWPAEASGNAIQICFVGASGVHSSLHTATLDKRVGARSVTSRPLKRGDDAGGCTVVYFASNEIGESAALLQSARATALTVSDARDFTRNGGVIQLFTEENRLRFVINVENARRAGVRISSNLLKLASNVEQDGAP